MNTYKVPGTFIEETAKPAPSVSGTSTAIPAFIGYTQKTNRKGNEITPVRISSLKEYEDIFGTTTPASELWIFVGDIVSGTTLKNRYAFDYLEPPVHTMYYHMQVYFGNNGGPCYIVSVGIEKGTIIKADLLAGLDAIEKYEDPTLIAFPEGVNIKTGDIISAQWSIKDALYNLDWYRYFTDAAKQNFSEQQLNLDVARQKVVTLTSSLNKLRAELDAIVPPALPSQTLLGNLAATQSALDTAATVVTAAETRYNYAVSNYNSNKGMIYWAEDSLSSARQDWQLKQAAYGGEELYDLYDQALEQCARLGNRFLIMDCYSENALTLRDAAKGIGKNNLQYGAAYYPQLETTVSYIYDEARVWVDYFYANGNRYLERTLKQLKNVNIPYANVAYKLAKDYLANQVCVTLPSCSAIAAVYASVDRTRGVWKAPANVSLNMVRKLTQDISDEEQELLNIDPVGGKSVNAIRTFSGKGHIVWGARTLAGNDNEWRYISVRRLFCMVESDLKKATEAFVFGNNDVAAWTKMQSMIENYLTNLWRAGALQGSKPEQAYYVSVGPGKTMTAQDILEGRLNIEIGMAAVKPAEFIVLRFSHMLAQS